MQQNSDYLKKVLLYIASFYARISPYYVTFLRLKDSISIAWKGWDRTDNEKWNRHFMQCGNMTLRHIYEFQRTLEILLCKAGIRQNDS